MSTSCDRLRRTAALLALVGAAAAAGCGGGVSGGDECLTPGARECRGSRLAVCTDGSWQQSGCDQVCAERGQISDGCDPAADPPGCRCSGGACEAGASRCLSETVLEECLEGAWDATDCPELCAAAGLESLGCGDESATGRHGCRCLSHETFPCPPGRTTCERGVVWTCGDDQLWTSTDCAAVCAADMQRSDGCRPDPEGGLHECVCAGCLPDAVRCDELFRLETCEDGIFVPHECVPWCAERGYEDSYGCRELPEGGSGCQCLYGTCLGAHEECPDGMVCAANRCNPAFGLFYLVSHVRAVFGESRTETEPWDPDGPPDAYWVITLDGVEAARGPVIDDQYQPGWIETGRIRVEEGVPFAIDLYDRDPDQPADMHAGGVAFAEGLTLERIRGAVVSYDSGAIRGLRSISFRIWPDQDQMP